MKTEKSSRRQMLKKASAFVVPTIVSFKMSELNANAYETFTGMGVGTGTGVRFRGRGHGVGGTHGVNGSGGFFKGGGASGNHSPW